ncbi:MAG: phosphoribosylformimino-5-aminoimidazole carboxamide ribotide isomerase [Oscillospiraceae bacterium]
MKFRPCIDIHNGKVKQIVGGTLKDENSFAKENFVSDYDGEFYGRLYKQYGLKGGHIILLNPVSSEYYNADCRQAFSALKVFEGGLQIGGGITNENAGEFLDKGASHVIVTSFVFKDGVINFDNINKMTKAVGKDKLVLDLSCRKRNGEYYIVTDRWQKFTDTKLNEQTVLMLADCCDEFLVHAVDVEGKASGIESELAEMLGKCCPIPVTYAGGISSFENLDKLKTLGRGRLDFTIGSALDIFGGNMPFKDVVKYNRKQN